MADSGNQADWLESSFGDRKDLNAWEDSWLAWGSDDNVDVQTTMSSLSSMFSLNTAADTSAGAQSGASLKLNFEGLKSNVGTLKSSFDKTKSELASIKSTISAIEAENTETTATLTTAVEDLITAKGRLKISKQEISALKTTCQDTQTTVETAVKDLGAAKSEIKAIKDAAADAAATVTDTKAKVDAVAASTEACNDGLQNLRETVLAVEVAGKDAASNIESITNDLAATKDELQRLSKGTTSKFDLEAEDLQNLRETVLAVEVAGKDAASNIESITNDLAATKDELQRLSKGTTSKLDLEAEDLEALKGEILTLSNAIAEVKADTETAAAKSLSVEEGKASKCAADISQLAKRVEGNTAAREQTDAKVDSTNGELAAIANEVSKLKAEITELEAKLASKSDDFAATKDAVESLKKEMNARTDDFAATKVEAESLKKEIKALRSLDEKKQTLVNGAVEKANDCLYKLGGLESDLQAQAASLGETCGASSGGTACASVGSIDLSRVVKSNPALLIGLGVLAFVLVSGILLFLRLSRQVKDLQEELENIRRAKSEAEWKKIFKKNPDGSFSYKKDSVITTNKDNVDDYQSGYDRKKDTEQKGTAGKMGDGQKNPKTPEQKGQKKGIAGKMGDGPKNAKTPEQKGKEGDKIKQEER